MSHNNGWMGHHHTEESKAKNRLAHIGIYPSDEARAKMSKARIGSVHSEETKNKMRISKLGVKRSEETKAKMRLANLGKIMSEESKLKNRLTHLGRAFTEERKANMRGNKSIETRAKMSKAQLGNKKSLGNRHSEEAKAKMSQAKKAQWKIPEYKERVMRASMLGRFIHPNKPESILLGLLEQNYPQEWKFVGDGSLIIAGKNPDFANVNGQKALIEVFGDYWHKGENPQDRIDIFKGYGFKTLVIWESELKYSDKVLSRIAKFRED